MKKLAIEGGMPIRPDLLPYGRQQIDDADIQAVVNVLRGDWLTTGPNVDAFEEAFSAKTGAKYAVAVNSGTAALHAAMFALDIKPGDEVIVSAMTFAASANCVIYQGGTPVFTDVEMDTLLLDATQVEEKITSRTKAIIAVDYAGQPCDYDTLRNIADKYGLALVADAAHSLGGSYKERAVGTLADLNTFSLHPVKHITTGEGGVITTDNADLAQKMRYFRTHGITSDHRQRAERGGWFYEMVDLGYNYRIPDINCALGISQLNKLDSWVSRRRNITLEYDLAFADIPAVTPLTIRPERSSAWHIYPILLETEYLRVGREQIFAALRAENIGVNVHYIPVYWHPYYARHGYKHGLCAITENAYNRLITLPIFPAMSKQDVKDVIAAVKKVMEAYAI
ncbi:MAG: UDP-4-amino-4,6-dideoxy-N-acetyl-beta-L-altrosamine transaminase [Chloroflexi bacterium]|nr:MAG: UDP-4-amino-4,6-dideoxy-N-acetyl-beta-L-altrosamine transaminase [Chloroflexota bacterium]